MRRHIPGLHSGQQDPEDNLDGTPLGPCGGDLQESQRKYKLFWRYLCMIIVRIAHATIRARCYTSVLNRNSHEPSLENHEYCRRSSESPEDCSPNAGDASPS